MSPQNGRQASGIYDRCRCCFPIKFRVTISYSRITSFSMPVPCLILLPIECWKQYMIISLLSIYAKMSLDFELWFIPIIIAILISLATASNSIPTRLRLPYFRFTFNYVWYFISVISVLRWPLWELIFSAFAELWFSRQISWPPLKFSASLSLSIPKCAFAPALIALSPRYRRYLSYAKCDFSFLAAFLLIDIYFFRFATMPLHADNYLIISYFRHFNNFAVTPFTRSDNILRVFPEQRTRYFITRPDLISFHRCHNTPRCREWICLMHFIFVTNLSHLLLISAHFFSTKFTYATKMPLI